MCQFIQINLSEADHKPIITLFLIIFVVAQKNHFNINDKKLGNLEIKNYTNKFLERPESSLVSLRSRIKKIFYGTYGGVLEYDGINVKR